METTNKTLPVCWKCAGSGLFVWRSGERDVCFPCEGSGRCEAREVKPLPLRATDWRLTLRTWYRNARLPAAHPCRFEYASILDTGTYGMGWTQGGLDAALDSVPGSREAFRALGWPV